MEGWRSCGLCGQTVYDRLNRIGVINKINSLTAFEKEKIEALYRKGFIAGDGQFDALKAELKRSSIVIQRHARSLGLTTLKRKRSGKMKENLSKFHKKRHLEFGHPRGMLGKKHTEETLKKISKGSIQRWKDRTAEQNQEITTKQQKSRIANKTNLPERFNATWKCGWRSIGGKENFYRSRWEANYARYLEWLKINKQILDWQHEPTTFWFEGIKRGVRSYLPDFSVLTLDNKVEYHEVKGWVDSRSITKTKRMAKYFPEIKLLQIEAKQYHSIAKTMMPIIKDWETKNSPYTNIPTVKKLPKGYAIGSIQPEYVRSSKKGLKADV